MASPSYIELKDMSCKPTFWEKEVIEKSVKRSTKKGDNPKFFLGSLTKCCCVCNVDGKRSIFEYINNRWVHPEHADLIDIMNKKIFFGKYKKQTWGYILENNFQYVKWAIENCDCVPKEDKEMLNKICKLRTGDDQK